MARQAHIRDDIDRESIDMAEEQVVFLKQRYEMSAVDIIQLYGGQTLGDETFDDAVERIALFNWYLASRNGFLAA